MKCILFLLLLTVFSSVNSDTLPGVLADTTKEQISPSDSSDTPKTVLDSVSAQDTLLSQTEDTTKSVSLPDSLKDTLAVTTNSADTNSPGLLPDSIKNVLRSKNTKQPQQHLNRNDINGDTVQSLNGWHFGYGIGFSLGSLDILKSWERTLPTSLDSLGLDSRSFEKNDTANGPLLPTDTTLIEFKQLEEPTTYSITFPFTVSISRFREYDRFMSSLSFSYISKQQKALIFSKNDTTGSRVDIKNKIDFYSLTLNVIYSRQIPPEYFAINKFDRTDFFIGLGLSPLVSIGTSYKVSSHYEEQNERMKSIEQVVLDSTHSSLNAYGLAVSFRAGISTIRHLSAKRSLEVTLAWSLNKYDYFKNNGAKVFERDIDKKSESTSELSFLSNRFDISFSLLRRLGNNQEK
ncbi:MAG: hypothetical protein Q4F84_04610 [Fibrobacter sp.]|nr:hypothetical protein [Fibrobacter sp.]